MSVDIKISPENLLPWSGMEDWESGASAAPTEHVLAGSGAAVARESTTIKIGTYSAKVTFGAADATLYYDLPSFADYQGRKMTLGFWVYTATASLAKIQIGDGVGTSTSSFHTGGSSWEFLTVTRDIDVSATRIRVLCFVDIAGFAYFDSGILVDGDTTFTILTDSMDVGKFVPASRYRGQEFRVSRRTGMKIPNMQIESKTIQLEGMIVGTTAAAARTSHDTLNKALNSIRSKPNGDKEVRDLYLFDDRLLRGFVRDFKPNFIAALRVRKVKWQFVVPDPFYQSVNKTRVTQDISSSPQAFTVTTLGTGLMRPVITVSATGGAMTSLTIENLTTNQTLAYTGSIAAGEAVVIDTDAITVLNDGDDDIANASDDLDTFLVPGANLFKITSNNGNECKVDWFDKWH